MIDAMSYMYDTLYALIFFYASTNSNTMQLIQAFISK